MPEHDPHPEAEPVESGDGLRFHDDTSSQPVVPGGRRRARRRMSGCLPILVALAVVAVGGWFVVTRGIDAITDQFGGSDAADYARDEQGAPVTVEVLEGASVTTIAQTLLDQGVVASTEAFVEVSQEDGDPTIQPGVYRVPTRLPAQEALDVLVAGTTRGSQFNILPGKTVAELVDLLVEDTDLSAREFEEALDQPKALGLPAAADGNAEGYLYPGQYVFFSDTSAADVLKQMVDRWRSETEKVGLTAKAKQLGYSVHDVMTVASMVQAEGSLLDEEGKARIARVIYNRLENPGTQGTVGLLQIDATIDFIYGDKAARRTIPEIQAVADNPYNTYTQTGLPPGPIAAPGAEAIRAATQPAEGDWYYYATVNLRTGETKFAETPEEFAQLDAELDAFCARSDLC
jgi:UPF0755 protein